METKLLKLEDFILEGRLSEADKKKLDEAAKVIKTGGLAAFPTETVYGLGGNALMKEAAGKIYKAKGRPSDNPLIVHISHVSDLEKIVSEIPEMSKPVMEAFWPGPMTLIFKKNASVPAETTGGLGTVAVRFPSHPAANYLIEKAGVPIAAPSANLSGRPSTTSALHCIEDLLGKVDMIIDGGSCDVGLESTIIDFTGKIPVILRPGAVTKAMIEELLNIEVMEDAALKGPLDGEERPKAPGMKYRHYAPKAPMLLVSAGVKGHENMVPDKILELIRENRKAYDRPALLCSKECADIIGADELSGIDVRITGNLSDMAGIAKGLFKHLREFDEDGADIIIAEGYGEEEIGEAVMNRLKKAAAWRIIYV